MQCPNCGCEIYFINTCEECKPNVKIRVFEADLKLCVFDDEFSGVQA